MAVLEAVMPNITLMPGVKAMDNVSKYSIRRLCDLIIFC